ncbi:helix-turn-helix transcriptional regulator [Ralstonia solanacearum]|uniref:helix-turn-helix domain-containing protein n=1 Tax=Ralstonia solanacearum TaxID=305 RepID=UPI002F94A867
MTALGVFIRQRRVSRDLTQADLARQIGVDATYISGIESGRKRPGSTQLLKAIGDALQLNEEGRAALQKAADLSRRSLRLSAELSPEKSELMNAFAADLPYLDASGVEILANVLAALRLQRNGIARLAEQPEPGGAM